MDLTLNRFRPKFVFLPSTAAKCKQKDAQGGSMINPETGKAFTRSDACAGIGATVGYNKEAHQKSIEDLKRELKSIFQLESR
jgi:hypothetical protein